MTKPVIVTRAGKGSQLTWVEGDTNFTNLQNATFTITDGTTPITNDLNSTLTLVPGANMLLTMDNTTKTITIDATAEDQRFVAYNNTGSTILKGSVVYVTGSQGSHPTIALAQANSEMTSAGTIGFAYTDISDATTGYVQTGGNLKQVNTLGLTEGVTIYLSDTTPGAYTTTKPTAPNHMVVLGWVITASASAGRIFIRVDNGYELDELHNVLITTIANNDILKYNSSTGLWNNAVEYSYTLPSATTSTLGGVKVDGISITAIDGVISALGSGSGVASLICYNANGTQDDIALSAFTTLTQLTINTELLLKANSVISIDTTATYGWDDYLSEFQLRGSGVNDPSWATLFGNMQGLVFSASSMQQVWTDTHVLHDYALGTAMYPHIHWTPTTTATGTVRWGIEYTIAKGHGQQAFNTTTTTIFVEHTISTASQWVHFVTEVSEGNAIPGTNLEPDSVIKCRVFRDAANANDTYPGTVHAWQMDMHYQKNRYATKNKAPNFYV